jgi:glycosyltransferase involved in cell wall biosynthesis
MAPIGRTRPADGAPGSLVSVVIPVFNGEAYLAAAIESALAQDYRPREIIVVNDGSTDASAAIAGSYPEVHCISQPNRGLAGALNSGVRGARGRYLAFLDADDLWLPGKLSRQAAVLDREPELDIVFGHFRKIYGPEGPETIAAGGLRDRELLPGYVKGTALVRRASFARVGPFDTGLRLGDFIDWFARAQDLGLRMRMLPEAVLLRRVHDRNISRLHRASRSDYVRILKAALDRRRRAASPGGSAAAGPDDETGRER